MTLLSEDGSGTSGNRTGYKVFSLNTTVRNPKRNIDFLEVFVPFDGKPFTSDSKVKYLAECVKKGIYRFTNIDESVRRKLDNDIQLSPQEVQQAFRDNPQATGFANRVVTQLRGLKDQGLLEFCDDKGDRGAPIYRITSLGQALLDNSVSSSDVYTTAMIALHGRSPIRETMLNESRPFLNTLFVMNEVKNELEKRGMDFKGIHLHEFAAFVLSMKDCDYRKAASEIIRYREVFGNSMNQEYIENFLFKGQGLLKVSFSTVMKDYVDDVFRKFELTGLLRKRGAYNNTYIDFSIQNSEKISQILKSFSGYYWHRFRDCHDYYEFVDSIVLPWREDENARRKMLQARADYFGIDICDFPSLDLIEERLNEIGSKAAIKKQVDKFELSQIVRELLILSGEVEGEPHSSVKNLPEPVRLEFLLALLFAKKFGPEGVYSNLLYNDDGEPLSFAPGNRPDICLSYTDLNIVVEATMIKAKNQQVNSETTSLSRHLQDARERSGIDFALTLVAPFIHRDTCDYFEYLGSRHHQRVCPLTFSRIAELLQISESPRAFANNFALVTEALKENAGSFSEFLSFVNSKYMSFSINESLFSNQWLKALLYLLKQADSKNLLFRIPSLMRRE